MCGIIGQLNRSKRIDLASFKAMRDRMYHRGPDGAGTKFFEAQRVALGHRRLSIIDLSASGTQPMSNEDGSIWVTFNGEIYNYPVLREQLEQTGEHRFKSNSDTEVLLHGYEAWGLEGLLQRLKGMFAFGIWDNNRKKLLLARDRFGIKPLVYHTQNDLFLFASELKAIRHCPQVQSDIDPSALSDYFIYSYVPYPKTIWKNTYKLPPAHYLSLDYETFNIEINQYWHLTYSDTRIPEEDAIAQTNLLIRKATQEHLLSDVPVGLFLSGGYDSSTLLMHMTDLGYPTSCYTIAFPDSIRNEEAQASLLAETFAARHEVEAIRADSDIFALLQEMAPIYDEPFAGSSMINTYLISRLAAKHGKVALSGEGADEVFGGYKWHRKIERYYDEYSLKTKAKEWLKGDFTAQRAFISLYNRSMLGVMQEAEAAPYLPDELKKHIRKQGLWHFDHFYTNISDPVKRCQYIDTHTFIPDHCLFRGDLSSMAHSLEVRVPFLDHEIYEFIFSLQRSVYMKKKVKKYLLEVPLSKRVPEEVLNMPKNGFSFQNPENMFDEQFESLLGNGQLVKQGILQRHIQWSTVSEQMKLQLLNLELWMAHHG